MDRAKRLVNWELEHGFSGVYASGGRAIYRKCECGRRTDRLADAQCTVCKGVTRINQRFQCRKDGCSNQARKGWGMLCRLCWSAEDPEGAARVLREWEEEKGFAGTVYGTYIMRKCACGRPTNSLEQAMCGVCTRREAKVASGFKPRRLPAASKVRHACVTDGCGYVASYAMGTLCEHCYVQADPDARGCPRCKVYKQTQSREDRLCRICVRRDVQAAIREVAADTMPPVRTSDLSMAALADSIRLDEADAENLEDALGGHLGECVMVD